MGDLVIEIGRATTASGRPLSVMNDRLRVSARACLQNGRRLPGDAEFLELGEPRPTAQCPFPMYESVRLERDRPACIARLVEGVLEGEQCPALDL